MNAKRCLRTAFFVCRLTFAAFPAWAHHSAAAKYDALHQVTLTGTVSEFAWRNPHCFLYLNVESGDYKGRPYVVEMSSAVVLSAAGWSKSRLKPGDRVEITVMPARDAKSASGLCREGCEIRVNGSVAR